MKSIIIAIGDELITGFRKETNSKWLSRKLTDLNIDVLSIILIGDNKKEILTTLANVSLKKDIDYVFITGGLGPTNDDLTLESLAEFMNSDIFLDESYFEELNIKLKTKNLKTSGMIKNQSMKIKDTNSIKNNLGTALGVTFSKKNKIFFAYPGIPSEFKKMFLDSFYKNNDINKSTSSVALNAVISESEIYKKLEDLIKVNKNKIRFSFLPSYKGVTVKLTALDLDTDISSLKLKVINRMGKSFYSEGDISLENVVVELLLSKNLTISISESCTGGFINNILSSIPNSSQFYKGGVIAYSKQSKQKLLKISKDKIIKHGAVSSEIGADMATNIRSIIISDIGLSTTGYSGPKGGDALNLNGTVYISIDFLGKIYSKKYIFIPNRDIHRLITAYTALNLLRLILIEEIE